LKIIRIDTELIKPTFYKKSVGFIFSHTGKLLYQKIRLYTGKSERVKIFTEKVKTHIYRKTLMFTGKSVKVKK